MNNGINNFDIKLQNKFDLNQLDELPINICGNYCNYLKPN